MADARAIFAGYAQDEEVVRFLPWRPHRSLADTREFLRRCRRAWMEGTAFPLAIERRGESGLIGMIQLRIRSPAVSLGYVLARSCWKQGIMTEAMAPLVTWALAQPEIYRVWAICDVANEASARLLERAGFQHEGILHRWIAHPNTGEVPRDAHCYALVR
jgi:RimJ/RimL family protein N-acetyltransferase